VVKHTKKATKKIDFFYLSKDVATSTAMVYDGVNLAIFIFKCPNLPLSLKKDALHGSNPS
jgi:hypothetical protein